MKAHTLPQWEKRSSRPLSFPQARRDHGRKQLNPHWRLRLSTDLSGFQQLLSSLVANCPNRLSCVQPWADSADSCNSKEHWCHPSKAARKYPCHRAGRGQRTPTCFHWLGYSDIRKLVIQQISSSGYCCRQGIWEFVEISDDAAAWCRAADVLRWRAVQ